VRAAVQLGGERGIDHSGGAPSGSSPGTPSIQYYRRKWLSPPGLWPAWPSCWWDSSITRTLSGAKASVMAEKHSKSGKLKYAIDPHGPSIGRAAQWHWYVYEPGRPGVLATGVAKGARRNAELEGQAAIHRLERERERKKSKRKVQRRGSKAS